jgi:hypothetical protein
LPPDGEAKPEGSAGYRRALRLRTAGELEEGIAVALAETQVVEPYAVHLRLRMFYEHQDFAALQAEARRVTRALTRGGVALVTSEDLTTLLRFADSACFADDTVAALLQSIGFRARRDPDLSASWHATHYRLKFRRGFASRYRGAASIVSLGHNCLPWTIPGFWGLRSEDDFDRLFVPFALGGHTADGIITPIAEDFASYCTPETIRIIKTARGHNLAIRADRTTHWNHNRGPYWLSDGARRLMANMAAKAQRFRDACKRPDVVFLMATSPVDYPAEPLDFLPALQAALARHTGTEANRIIITNQTNRNAKPGYRRVTDTVAFLNCPYPAKDYVWHDDATAETDDGLAFERGYVSLLLRALLGWGLYRRVDDPPAADMSADAA